MTDPRDPALLHRLEAFSDIVMGFSLALLGLNLHLRLPPAASDLIVFLTGFALIALVWWYHNRLFARYFVADTLSIILNFAMLAGVVVVIWVVELVASIFVSPGAFAPRMFLSGFGLWLLAYGVVMTLLGAMYALGLRARGMELPRDVRIWGVRRAANAGFGGIGLIAMGLILPLLPLKFAFVIAVFAFVPAIAERLAVKKV